MVSEGSSATLHIIKLEQDDAGLYECKVSNKVGTESCRTTISLKGWYTISGLLPNSLVFVLYLLIHYTSIIVQKNQHLSTNWSTSP